MTRKRTGDIQVHGLREVSAALKAIGPDARTELKDASRTVAGFVADDTRSAAYTIGGVAAHVAPSIKPVASATGSAGVAIGGGAYPMAGGAAWGGRARPSTQQFQPYRKEGYFLYPQIKQDAERIVEEYGAALDRIIERRFPQ